MPVGPSVHTSDTAGVPLTEAWPASASATVTVKGPTSLPLSICFSLFKVLESTFKFADQLRVNFTVPRTVVYIVGDCRG